MKSSSKWIGGSLKKHFRKLFHPAEPGTEEPEGVPGHPVQYRIEQTITIVLYGLIGMTSVLYWNASFTPFGPIFNFGPLGCLIIGLHFGSSLRMVDADKTAGAFSFGKGLKRLKSGLHFIPAILMQMKTNSRLIQDSQFPGAPEQVFRRDDGLPIRPGQVQPVRIVTGGPEKAADPDDPDSILDTQMTLEVSWVNQWRITDTLNFVANYGTIEHVIVQLRDVGEATLAEDFSQKTPKEIISTLPTINELLVTEVSKRFPHAGFELVSARLISPDVSHGVSTAMADIPVARAKATATRITASAERDRASEEGLGIANAREALLDADAKGYEKIKSKLGVSGELVLAAEVARPAAENAKVIIAGAKGGIADLLGIATGAREALDATKTKETTP